ncbi:uncharacterized protein LOC134287623 [Aedes albopictus]|uniref:Reverse transcriptase domain-containing protein n=1 Tax=Aedes albopictus TaxID=7160 RepID=A0ABM1Z9J3_AEDAL
MAALQHSFFRYIDENYEHSTADAMKSYASNNKKLANLQNQKSFLIMCRRQGVFPSHIVNSFKCVHQLLAENGPYVNKIDRTINRFKRAILNLEIKQTFFKIKQVEKQMKTLVSDIRSLTSESVINEFIITQRAAHNGWLGRNSRRTSRKLTNIVQGITSNDRQQPSFNERAILNATELDIPTNTLHLLSLGPKFALPTTSLSQIAFYHLFAETERILLTNGDKKVQDTNRCRIVNVTQNFIHGFHSMVDTRDSVTKFCVSATNTTKRFLQSHPEICVLSADKGNRTVIMRREDYDNKMRALVNDATTYEKVKTDPTSRYQSGNNNIVKRLKDLKLIDYRTANDLTSTNAICPRIYGQPKAHKPDLPLRPVIPNVTAPTYKLAKYIAGILQSSFHSQYNTSSSFEFCNEVNNITLPEGYIMISLDVTSLFTNVPRRLVIKSIIERWNEVKTHINLDLFLEIVEYCMVASYFCFEGQYFKQTFGTAMGSPLSPIIADIVLDSVICTAMQSLPFEITIFRKYVDDIFMAIPRNSIQLVLETFNSIEPRLQFTIECEKDHRLAFLDMTVIRNEDQTLTTDWYAKPIASGRMLNYTSFHQPKHKINVANNFIHRVCSLTRNKTMQEITDLIHHHLRINNYPKHLINRLLNMYTTKPEATHPQTSNPPSRPSCQLSPIPPTTPPRTANTTESTQHQPFHQPHTQPAIMPDSHPQTNSPPSRPSCQLSPVPPTTSSTSGNTTGSTLCQPQHQPPSQPAILPANPTQLDPPLQNSSDVIIADQNLQTRTTSINQTINTTGPMNHLQRAEQPEMTQYEKTYRSIPYVPTLTRRITKILAKDYPNITITTRQSRMVNQLHTKVKHPTNRGEISNVIYKIPCNNCDSCYVGMTRNNLSRRLIGHKSNVNKLEKIMSNSQTNTDTAKATLIETTTALIQHCIQHNHRFNLDLTQIIDHSYKPTILPFLEMCHITNTDHTVNKRTDIDRLSTTYAAVLHSIKNMTIRYKPNTQDNSVDQT